MFKSWNHRLRKTGILLLGSIQVAVLAAPLQGWASEAAAPADGQLVVPAGQRQMEYLDRGVVAVQTEEGVFVSWRLLGTEPPHTAFNVYRDGRRVNRAPITGGTNLLDPGGRVGSKYTVSTVVYGRENSKSKPSSVWEDTYLSLPLHKPTDGVSPNGSSFTYRANDASTGDLDGDGEYEIILKWDPSNSQDNTGEAVTGEVYLDAYKLNGSKLWRIGLGKNIRAGAHYTQFMVYDLDGDGRAEIAAKTADGTTDGTGRVIGDPNADYRNADGRILDGPEFLTIFDGTTGRELVTTDYDPPRGNPADMKEIWGDDYGNRVDRFLAGIAYLDGKRPSLIMARGYYARSVIAAYNWRDGELSKVWTFDSSLPGNEGYGGQGNHSLSVGDVDQDGKDEIVYGAMALDDDGRGLYTTRLGHGDAMHLGDLDPGRPGLEVFQVHESKSVPYHAEYRDAATGDLIWGVFTGKDTGRGMSADIDPRYPGEEVWASAGVGMYSSQGTAIGTATPSINFGIWWDGDLGRELLDHRYNRTVSAGAGTIDKWDYENGVPVNLLTAEGTYSSNGTKGNPSLTADLLGDWREEAIWRTEDSSALRIYTTTDVTEHRIHTLMHDPIYRLGVAWQNVGYNQPPHPGFFLGYGMITPPQPDIYTILPVQADVHPKTLNVKSQGGKINASLSLPKGYDASSIKPSSVTVTVVGGGSPVYTSGKIRGKGGHAEVSFDRQQVIGALQDARGKVELRITGMLNDGHRFASSVTIHVID